MEEERERRMAAPVQMSRVPPDSQQPPDSPQQPPDKQPAHTPASTIHTALAATNHFKALQLTPQRTPPQRVRSTFRKLARLCHPDKCSLEGATQAFQVLQEAFEILYDQHAQNQYLAELQMQTRMMNRDRSSRKRTRRRKKRKRKEFQWGESWAEVEKELKRREVEEAKARERFVHRNSQQYDAKKTYRLLKKCLSICEEMDERKQIDNNDIVEQLQSVETIEEKAELLSQLLEYLRTKHYYCIFCGAAYMDQNDINTNCPGNDEEKH